MASIGKTFTFEAAHRLQNHNGKCRNLHGHSYRVEVQITGPVTSEVESAQDGMVMDFGDLKSWWRPLESQLDHRTILANDDPLFSGLLELGVAVTEFHLAPTAENIAAWLLGDLQDWLIKLWPEGFVTPTVRVWETANSWAEA